jgi:hypothetical protein
MTVDSKDVEDELQGLEATHVCSPDRLFEIRKKPNLDD